MAKTRQQLAAVAGVFAAMRQPLQAPCRARGREIAPVADSVCPPGRSTPAAGSAGGSASGGGRIDLRPPWVLGDNTAQA